MVSVAAISSYQQSDEERVRQAQQGGQAATEYLLVKYQSLVESKARLYYLVGADQEDIVQEGMIGLYKAIRDFRADRQISFRSFAELCITRQIYTAIKASTRQKHIPLNSYISLHATVYDADSDRTLMDLLEEPGAHDPVDTVITRQFADDFRRVMREELSELELALLHGYIRGLSFQEIADELKIHHKSVDNGIYRVKKKLKRSLKAIM